MAYLSHHITNYTIMSKKAKTFPLQSWRCGECGHSLYYPMSSDGKTLYCDGLDCPCEDGHHVFHSGINIRPASKPKPSSSRGQQNVDKTFECDCYRWDDDGYVCEPNCSSLRLPCGHYRSNVVRGVTKHCSECENVDESLDENIHWNPDDKSSTLLARATNCCNKSHQTIAGALLTSPEWKAWVEYNEKETQFDVNETQEIDTMSSEHFKAFIKYTIKHNAWITPFDYVKKHTQKCIAHRNANLNSACLCDLNCLVAGCKICGNNPTES